MLQRPHIEFIQAQVVPWRHIGSGLARPDAEYKFLSRDAVDGACSVLIRYTPGWCREGPEYQESGALRVPDRAHFMDTQRDAIARLRESGVL